MFDKRVVRGNTWAMRRKFANRPPDALNYESINEKIVISETVRRNTTLLGKRNNGKIVNGELRFRR